MVSLVMQNMLPGLGLPSQFDCSNEGASSIVDVPGRAACDMNAMIVGRVHGRESIRLRGARFFFKQILAECT
jgi:hypothetical protein